MSSADLALDPEELRQRAAETAFVRSAEYRFRGQKLQAYSFTRESAAEMLGLRFGSISEADLVRFPNPRKALLKAPDLSDEDRQTIEAEPEEVATYKGMARDVAIVLWLMHQPAEVASEARANPRKYALIIDEWADAQRIRTGDIHYGEALQLFNEIIADREASRGRPDLPADSTGDAAKNG